MSDSTPGTLTQRLERLEREVRWWRAGALAVLLGCLLVFLVSAAPPSTIETTRLVVKDGHGRVRAVLGMEVPGRGGPEPTDPRLRASSRSPQFGLFLYAEDGPEIGRLMDWEGTGATVFLTDRQRQVHASLSAGPGLGVLDVAASPRTAAERLGDLDTLLKRAERERWSDAQISDAMRALSREASVLLSVTSRPLVYSLVGKSERGYTYVGDVTEPLLRIADTRAAAGAGVDVTMSGLKLSDTNAKKRASLQLSEDGAPGLRLFDAGGKTRAALGAADLPGARAGSVDRRAESSLVLSGKDGRPIWRAP